MYTLNPSFMDDAFPLKINSISSYEYDFLL